jgi:diguanylate cyclase (GGDEF)-like protein
MKLSQRADLILLPVIMLVFLAGAYISIKEVENQSTTVQSQRLLQELHNIQVDIVHHAAIMNSALDQLISHPVLSNPKASDAGIRNAALTATLYRMHADLQEQLPMIGVMQLFDNQQQLLESADNRDPFDEPQPFAIPDWLSWANKDQLLTASQLFLFRDADDAIGLGLLQPFVPGLPMSSLQVASNNDRRLYALLTLWLYGKPDALLSGRPLLQEGFSLQLKSKPVLAARLQTRGEKSIGSQLRGDILMNGLQATSQTPLYTASLQAPDNYVRDQLSAVTQEIWSLAVLQIIGTFALLKLLISRQMIKPLISLISQIQAVRSDTSLPLKPSSGKDEISELNNAYVDLFDEIKNLASYDSLTGLANRRSFHHSLTQQLQQSLAQNKQVGLLFIDLDNFKQVNDRYGHETGDKLLCSYSQHLQSLVRPQDLVTNQIARLAGDEFAVLLVDIPGVNTAIKVAKRLLTATRGGLEIDGVTHNVEASIGIAMAPDDTSDEVELLNFADAAMYIAKQAGRNHFQVYDQEIARQIQERESIEASLTAALEDGSFYLVYQPKYQADTLRIIGAEVLLRCNHPLLNQVGPEKFIPIAESSGLIRNIDLWVIDQALRVLLIMQKRDCFDGIFNINFSAAELHNPHFAEDVNALLVKHGVSPASIELEVTETTLVESDQESIDVLLSLRELGVSIALDDFGTGYTAFSQLNRYPVNTLKIDRSFVAGMDQQQGDHRPMLDVILEIARTFRLDTVAEGVETEAQLERLRELGCEQLQGYYLSRPLPLADFREKIKAQKPAGGTIENITEDG